MMNDAHWMRIALEEARKANGLTSPNPPVGAAIIKGNELLAAAHHQFAGGPHAEVNAINAATAAHGASAIEGETIYVTLEPCSTTGKTPPCTNAIRDAGFSRVVFGSSDPNPANHGKAAKALSESGIKVTQGVHRDECDALLAPWKKFITTGRPWVIAKAAVSLDGKITRPDGEGQWLTGEKAREHSMQFRRRADAILVGANTVRADNPKLTVRGETADGKKPPWLGVLTRSGYLPDDAHLFTDTFKDQTLVFRDGLQEALDELAAKECVTVLLEGGGQLLGQAFAAQFVDEAAFYVAPMICGNDCVDSVGVAVPSSIQLANVETAKLDSDIVVSGIVVRAPRP
ncbi:MAG: bifunctional diaminohydroxyphosphoribosylaminopyrimidine deaminase/5-amino-6-(5-phosphoribosylamino)uracil reductase RibD [Verrucomicrobiota bacterium]